MTKRTHAELAEYHAAQAEKYRRLVSIRGSKKLARLRRAAKLVRKVAEDLADVDTDTSTGCLVIANDIDRCVSSMLGADAPTLPFAAEEESSNES